MKGCNINEYLVIKTQVNYIATQCLDAAVVFRILQLGGRVMTEMCPFTVFLFILYKSIFKPLMFVFP